MHFLFFHEQEQLSGMSFRGTQSSHLSLLTNNEEVCWAAIGQSKIKPAFQGCMFWVGSLAQNEAESWDLKHRDGQLV